MFVLEKMGSSSISILVPYETSAKISFQSELLRKRRDMFKIEKKKLNYNFSTAASITARETVQLEKMKILNRLFFSQSIFYQTFSSCKREITT